MATPLITTCLFPDKSCRYFFASFKSFGLVKTIFLYLTIVSQQIKKSWGSARFFIEKALFFASLRAKCLAFLLIKFSSKVGLINLNSGTSFFNKSIRLGDELPKITILI